MPARPTASNQLITAAAVECRTGLPMDLSVFLHPLASTLVAIHHNHFNCGTTDGAPIGLTGTHSFTSVANALLCCTRNGSNVTEGQD